MDRQPDVINEELANSDTYKHDEKDWVIRETREVSLAPGFSDFQYEHDFSEKRTKLTYPDGYWMEYRQYDGTGLFHTGAGSNGVQFSR